MLVQGDVGTVRDNQGTNSVGTGSTADGWERRNAGA